MKLRSVIGLAAFVFLVGCSHDNSTSAPGGTAATPTKDTKASVVGKWKMDPEAAKEEPPGQQPGFMAGFASTFKYEFKANNSFSGSMSEGTYTFADNKLSVLTTKLAGQDTHATAAQMTGELSADGKTLTMHPPDGPGLKMLTEKLQKGIPMIRDDS